MAVLNSNFQAGGTPSGFLLSWLLFCAIPLFFVFIYPGTSFAVSSTRKRRKYAALLHALGPLAATVLFPVLALPFWKNPVRVIADSIPAVMLVALIVLSVFFVAALFLLLRNKSSLAAFASLLFWPAILACTRSGEADSFFSGTPVEAVFYFLCFMTPVLFDFAAGAVYYSPALSHAAALTGLVGAPWLDWSAIRGSVLGNVWL